MFVDVGVRVLGGDLDDDDEDDDDVEEEEEEDDDEQVEDHEEDDDECWLTLFLFDFVNGWLSLIFCFKVYM